MMLQALVTSSFQADQQMQQSAWLASLPTIPGLRGADLETALLTCVSNNTTCPTAEQGWGLLSRPIISFAVAQLEKGCVKAGELADALSGIRSQSVSQGFHLVIMTNGRRPNDANALELPTWPVYADKPGSPYSLRHEHLFCEHS